MSGGLKRAQHALERPLDRRVRPRRGRGASPCATVTAGTAENKELGAARRRLGHRRQAAAKTCNSAAAVELGGAAHVRKSPSEESAPASNAAEQCVLVCARASEQGTLHGTVPTQHRARVNSGPEQCELVQARVAAYSVSLQRSDEQGCSLGPNVRHERQTKAREACFWLSARWRG